MSDLLDTPTADIAAAQFYDERHGLRGKQPSEPRVRQLIALIRRYPGHRAGWYARQMGLDNKSGQRLLIAAERLGYRLSESDQGFLYVTDDIPDGDELGWLDIPQRPDAEGVKRLLFAVLAQAAVEAHDGNAEAIEWFNGDACRHYCESLDIDHADMIRKLAQHRARRVIRKPTGVGHNTTDQYRRQIFDRYDEWRRLGEPLRDYAARIGVNFATLRSQFHKFGLSVAYAPPREQS